MEQARKLIVVADDFGIGPEVSRGILELMLRGSVTSTVLLANSPFVEAAIRRWDRAGRPGEMGWHPNLTMDEPVARSRDVHTLLSEKGTFFPLGTLLLRIATGRFQYSHLVNELDAQYRRCHDLIGQPPKIVNGHKHIHVFPIIGQALAAVLKRWRVRPYIRRVVEPLSSWIRVPGARLKRMFLTLLGRWSARQQAPTNRRGNDSLAGISDPIWVEDPQFYARWLKRIPGRVVELMVHPGHRDKTLIGRDCSASDGQLERRVAEQRMLEHPSFLSACDRAGFVLQSTTQIQRVMRDTA
jgi:predicted glycoside hydrolase/deacetylase ChbG (UPF0249 family)